MMGNHELDVFRIPDTREFFTDAQTICVKIDD